MYNIVHNIMYHTSTAPLDRCKYITYNASRAHWGLVRSYKELNIDISRYYVFQIVCGKFQHRDKIVYTVKFPQDRYNKMLIYLSTS